MRIAGLDGLRAVAVVGVLLYHGGVAAVPGGFLGVDLFFVISGYLITTLLLREADRRGTVDLVDFWGRRVRRLLPALALVVGAVAVAGAVVGSDVRGDVLATLLYVANWHFAATEDGYFALLAAPSPLLHTWSLSIEEQFYLVWPVVLLLAVRRGSSRTALAAGTSVVAIASVAWMAVLAVRGADTDRLYLGTDTRAHTVLAGVVLALVLSRRERPARGGRRRPGRLHHGAAAFRARGGDVVAALSLAGVVAAMTVVPDTWAGLYLGGSAALALGCALLVAAVVRTPGGAVTRLLDVAPLRAVGVLSYGLYLWHWPLFLALTSERTGLTGPALLAARLAATLAVAAASYRLVERPARRARWPVPRRLAAPVGAVAVGCSVLVAVGLVPSSPATSNVAAARRATGRGESVQQVDRPPPSTAPALATIAATPSERPVDRPHRLRVTVLGDSTARTLGDGLRDVRGVDGVQFRVRATVGCGITTAMPYRYMGELTPYPRTRCASWEQTWRRAVTDHPPDVVAVLVGRWEVADQVVDGTWTHAGTRRFDAYLRDQLEKAVAAAGAGGAPIAFLTAPYYRRGESWAGSSWPEDDPARVDAVNRLIRAVAREHADRVRVVELGRRTSGGRHEYVEVVDGVDLRYDGVHFTPAASRWLQPWLTDSLRRVAALDDPPSPTPSVKTR